MQDEALRPFVAVLRHCDSVGVRERCVQCIALALTAHPRGLGSGQLSFQMHHVHSVESYSTLILSSAMEGSAFFQLSVFLGCLLAAVHP